MYSLSKRFHNLKKNFNQVKNITVSYCLHFFNSLYFFNSLLYTVSRESYVTVAFSVHNSVRRYKVCKYVFNVPLLWHFIYSLIQQSLLSIFYVVAVVLGTKDTAVSETLPVCSGLTF